MEYANFLDSLQDNYLRDELWDLFCKAETEAKWFPMNPNDWVDIERVIASSRSLWHDNGEIEIDPKRDDLGQIFHETFHSAFHNSPLWTDKVNNSWGDGFCDAFRYFMEERYLSGSKWLANIENYLTMSIEEIMQKPTNIGWKLEYCIPASRIVNKVGKNYDNFKSLWKELNRKYDDPLEDYFDFPKRNLWKNFRPKDE